jgi:hypothetical protein
MSAAVQEKPYHTAMQFNPKTCGVCGQAWMPKNRYQEKRDQACSRACGVQKTKGPRPHLLLSRPACQWCGKTFEPKSNLRLKAKTCGYACRDAMKNARPEWIAHLTAIASRGRSGWTDESRASYQLSMSGEKNPAWKGGVTYRNRHGNYVSVRYLRCPPDLLAMARKDGYVMEHRLTMARLIGRVLTRVECVHHVDHDPLNNSPKNLELWPDNRSHKLAEHGRFVEGAVNRLFPED